MTLSPYGLNAIIVSNSCLLLIYYLLVQGTRVGTATSLYLLCSILHIFKTKDLASTIAATLFCPLESFVTRSEATTNGYVPQQAVSQESEDHAPSFLAAQVNIEDSECTSTQTNHFSSQSEDCGSHITLRQLNSKIPSGVEKQSFADTQLSVDLTIIVM